MLDERKSSPEDSFQLDFKHGNKGGHTRFRCKDMQAEVVEENSSFSDSSLVQEKKNAVRRLQGISTVGRMEKEVHDEYSASSLRKITRASGNSIGISIFKPKDLRFEKHPDCKLITSEEIGQLMQGAVYNESFIIIDTRTFTEYINSHIKGALHLCLPSTLLKRKNFDVRRLIDNITPARREHISRCLLGSNDGKPFSVLIYDAISNHTDSSMSLACFGISSKILDYASSTSDFNVYVLSDGFENFKNQFPSLVEYSASPTDFNTNLNCNSPAFPSVLEDKIQYPSGATFKNPSLQHAYSKSCSGVPIESSSRLDYSQTYCDSPLSMSSPSSALFGFQMPMAHSRDFPVFKLPQIEHEIDDLSNYVEAVALNENRRSSYNHSKGSFQQFKFPQSTSDDNSSLSIPSSGCNLTSFSESTKLGFQLSYDEMLANSDPAIVERVVPVWFDELMKTSKMAFIRKFQKLELLESKRLRKMLSFSSQSTYDHHFLPSERDEYYDRTNAQSNNGNIGENNDHNKNTDDDNINDNDDKNSTSTSNKNINAEDDEFFEKGQTITVSSGVEFGSKNRYKDIFPYEHTRVVLSHSDISQCSTSSEYERVTDTRFISDTSIEDSNAWDTYINANYLTSPFFSTRDSTIRQVRYIATQAPLRETVADFYTCIVNNRVPLILSLTAEYENNMEKCFNFWSSGKYGHYKVELIDEYSTLEGESGLISSESSSKRELDSSSLDAQKNDRHSSPFGKSIDSSRVNLKHRKSYSLGANGVDSKHENSFLSCVDDRSHNDKSKQDCNEIIIRRIKLTYNEGKSTYELLQLHIENWPDLGTLLRPDEVLTMLNLKDLIIDGLFDENAFYSDNKPTVLVHCSAGCGRTGTICTIDSVLATFLKTNNTEDTFCMAPCSSFPCSRMFNLASKDVSISPSSDCPSSTFDPVFATVNQFRKQRISMVQNINQFLFVYDCLLGYINLKLKKSTKDDKCDKWEEMTKKYSNINIVSDFLMCKRSTCEQ